MIPTLFARPITIWVTIIVLILHGLALSAMISVETVVLPTTEPDKATPLQFDLITLSAQEVSVVALQLTDQLANKEVLSTEKALLKEDDPPVEDPPVEDPPVEDPPVEDPPVGDPSVKDPSVKDLSVEDLSVEDL